MFRKRHDAGVFTPTWDASAWYWSVRSRAALGPRLSKTTPNPHPKHPDRNPLLIGAALSSVCAFRCDPDSMWHRAFYEGWRYIRNTHRNRFVSDLKSTCQSNADIRLPSLPAVSLLPEREEDTRCFNKISDCQIGYHQITNRSVPPRIISADICL